MKFARDPNRIYTVMDFEDGEEIEFNHYPDRASAKAEGYVYYKSKQDGRTVLLTPEDIERCSK